MLVQIGKEVAVDSTAALLDDSLYGRITAPLAID